MAEVWFLVRLVHIVAGGGWLGEVLTVNFVLLPVLSRARAIERTHLLQTVFPCVFRLATALGGLAIVTGLTLLLWRTQLNPARLIESAWGWRILIGGTLGALLFLFHLVQEVRAERVLALAARLEAEWDNDPRSAASLLRRLAIIPRVGLGILLVIVGLMSAAAHLP
jgi:hypothetical protein